MYLIILPFVALGVAGLVREYLFWKKEDEKFPQQCGKISVIIPMRGVYPWTEENLAAITRHGDGVEYIFVVDSIDDPAYPVASKFGKVIVSGGDGKGAALAAGLSHASGDCIVFADDDIRPSEKWLYLMTSPLSRYDAVTTYRWYVGKGLCHKVRLAISNTGFPAMLDPRSRFVWGGSTAFRREFAESVGLGDRLRKFVSDDYAVYSALKERGGKIWFSKGAIAPTPDPSCGVREAFWWGVRQILMVKWHAPAGWKVGLVIYTLGFFISIVLPVVGLVSGRWDLLLGLALHPVNLVKDVVRGRGVARHAGIRVGLGDVVSTWAVGNFVIPLAVWASVFKKCINWRGRKICR